MQYRLEGGGLQHNQAVQRKQEIAMQIGMGGGGGRWLLDGGQQRHSTANEEVAMQTGGCNASGECNSTRWCDAISEGTAMQTQGALAIGRRGCMQWRVRLKCR